MRDIHQEVTDRILASLDSAGQWKPCWHRLGNVGMPLNAVTGKRYQGINVLLLWSEAQARGFESSRWATYKTWADAGAQVKKGEKSTAIVFWKQLTKTDEAGEEKRGGMVCKTFNVFNASQVIGDTRAPAAKAFEPTNIERIQAGQIFLDALAAGGMTLEHGQFDPHYAPGADAVRMPPFERFLIAEGYYTTAFHEAVHWTGHKDRQDRDCARKYGIDRKERAMEQLFDRLGRLTPDMRVLEPSAGRGRLADRAKLAGCEVQCVELQPELIYTLQGKGHSVKGGDFLTMTPAELGLFDVVVMNPPFDRGRDCDHVRHALQFLKPGGRLVSVMAAGLEYRETARAKAFRALIDKVQPPDKWDRRFTDLPAGSFAESGTNVNTMILRLETRR